MPFVPDEQQNTGFIPDKPSDPFARAGDMPAGMTMGSGVSGMQLPEHVGLEPTRQKAASGFVPDDTIGFWGAMKEKPHQYIPGVGAVADVVISTKDREAFARLEKGHDYAKPIAYSGLASGFGMMNKSPVYTTREKDVERLVNWINEANKKYSFGGRIGRIAKQLPPFMVEFLATSGLFSAGETVTKKMAVKALGKYAKSKAGRAATTMAGLGAGAVTQATFGLPHRTVQTFAERRLPEGLTVDGETGNVEFEWPEENPATSFVKAWGDTVIEVASERAGEFLPISGLAGKGATKVAKVGEGQLAKSAFGAKLIDKFYAGYKKLHPVMEKTEFAKQFMNKAGRQGILEELGEEYIGDSLRAITGTDDFGAGKGAGMKERLVAALKQDWENTPEMAAAFAIPAAGAHVAGGILSAPPSVEKIEAIAEQIKNSESLSDVEKVRELEKLQEIVTGEKAGVKKAGEVGDTYYHGTSADAADQITEGGFRLSKRAHDISISKDRSVAEFHAKRRGPRNKVLEVSINPDAKIFTTKDVPAKFKKRSVSTVELDTYARQNGYDGIDVAQLSADGVTKGVVGEEKEVTIFNTSVLSPTKSQQDLSAFDIPESTRKTVKVVRRLSETLADLESQRPELAKGIKKRRASVYQEQKKIREAHADPVEANKRAQAFAKQQLRATIPNLTEQFSQDDIASLHRAIKETKLLNEAEKTNLVDTFNDLFVKNVQPSRSQIKLFDKFFGTKILDSVNWKNLTKYQKTVHAINETLGISKALLASCDMSFGGVQAWPAFFKDPVNWFKGVGHGWRAMFSEDYARIRDIEIKTSPYYGQAVSTGIDHTEVGSKLRGEEAFISQLAHKIPLIGIAVRASDRGFVTAGNSIRFGLAYKTYEAWDGLVLPHEQYLEMSDHINNLTGRGKGEEGGKLERYMPELSAAFWTPRLWIATGKTVTDMATKKHIRQIAAHDLIQSLALMGVITGLASLIPDVEVETDLRSSDFLKVRVGQMRFNPFGRYQQVMRTAAQVIMGECKATGSGRISDVDRNKIVTKFLRSKLNPVVGMPADLFYFKETYMGEKVRWESDFMTKYIADHVTPLFIQDLRDAAKYQGMGTSTYIMAPLAVHGIGAQTYKTTPTQEAMELKNHLAHEYFGAEWDALGPEAQEALREQRPAIEQFERQADYEREDYSFLGNLADQENEAGRRVEKKLNRRVQDELRKHMVKVGQLSRRIGKSWYLNHDRYKAYQKDLVKALNHAMPKVVNSPGWAGMGSEAQRTYLETTLNDAKKYVRQQIIDKANAEDFARREEVKDERTTAK